MVADHDIAFRLRGVPSGLSKAQVKHAVEKALQAPEGSQVEINSLALDPERQEQQICTLSFSTLPPDLQGQREVTLAHPDGLSLVLDTYFEGFTPLHSSDDERCTTDIVAISGLNGHAFGSFKQKGGPHMWLRDSLPMDCTTARIFTYGYDTRIPSVQTIYDIARTFILLLGSLRPAEGPSRKLVLICHSLGGIIAKAALKLMAESDDMTDRRHLASLTGVLFFGVPGQGMRIDSVVEMTDESARRSLLYSLDDGNSPTLMELSGSFMQIMQSLGHCEACYFYETMKSPTAIRVDGRWTMEGPLDLLVTPSSAMQGVCRNSERHRVIPVNRSHSDLVKFNNKYDSMYTLTLQYLSSILSQTPTITRKRFHRRLSPDERSCLQSLSYQEQNWREQEMSIKAAKGTCGWIFEHENFHHWVNKPRTLLWITGNPGAGKSTLMRHIAEEKRKQVSNSCKETVATFFIHGRGSEIQKSPRGLYRSILHQILQTSPVLMAELTEEYVKNNEPKGKFEEKWSWTEDELREFFIHAVLQASRERPLTILVDALDEMGEEKATRIISEFESIIGLATSTMASNDIRICFSCRHYPVLVSPGALSISVEKENSEDIRRLVGTGRELRSLSERDRCIVMDLISEKARGVFQWVALVLEQLEPLVRRGKPLAALAAKINEVPTTLQGLYESLLSTECHGKQETLKLLQWVLFTIHPLNSVQLRDALAIDAAATFVSFAEMEQSSSFYSKDNMEAAVRSLSKGLIEITDTDIVQFIHGSVVDYLLHGGLQTFVGKSLHAVTEDAHFQLSRSCIKYLLLEEIRNLTAYQTRNTPHQISLANYARTFWIFHVIRVEEHGKDQRDLAHLLSWSIVKADRDLFASHIFRYDYSSFMSSWEMYEQWHGWRPELSFTAMLASKSPTIKRAFEFWSNRSYCAWKRFNDAWTCVDSERYFLGFLVLAGIRSAIREFGRIDPEIPEFVLAYYIEDAMDGLHYDFVQEGISSLRNINHRYGYNARMANTVCLIMAIFAGNLELVRMVLNSGAPLNYSSTRIMESGTPLYYAVQAGNKTFVSEFLSRGAEIIFYRRPDGDVLRKSFTIEPSSIHLACRMGNLEIVEIMLREQHSRGGLDEVVNIRDGENRTPLWHARKNGNISVEKLLLHFGADPARAENIVRHELSMVLDEEADGEDAKIILNNWKTEQSPELLDCVSNALLSQAASDGREQVVEILLEARMGDPNYQDCNGQTALMKAAMHGFEEIVACLLGFDGIDTILEDNDGCTALDHARASGDAETAKLLGGSDEEGQSEEGINGSGESSPDEMDVEEENYCLSGDEEMNCA